jgi:hypothetical protein
VSYSGEPEPVTVAADSVSYCLGTRTDGNPCESQIIGESGYCFAHDPDEAERRTQARRRGGHASSAISRTRRLAPAALKDVYGVLESALAEVHSGGLSPARASAMASLARAMVTVLTGGELEERIRRIEEAYDFPA